LPRGRGGFVADSRTAGLPARRSLAAAAGAAARAAGERPAAGAGAGAAARACLVAPAIELP
jgi:hypothetical protein